VAQKFRWGIIGTGFIAGQFASDLKLLPNAQLHAVSSRNVESAKKFAAQFGAKKSFGSRDEMLFDKETDIIYVATPNHCHVSDSIAALNAGKAVLCEKPFALSSTELESIIAVAKAKNLFLMEALWTAFLPSFRKFTQLANDGSIGEPMLLNADFGFNSPFNPASRLYDPKQGGGSVYDIGIYPLFAAYSLFGEPLVLQSIKVPSPTGTDAFAAIQTRHENNKIAMLASSFAFDLDTEAKLYGTSGKLKLHKCFHIPTKLTMQNEKGSSDFEFPEAGNGYQHEALAAMNAIENGLTECPEWNLSKSCALMRMIDSVLLVLILAVSALADSWIQYYGQSDVRDVAKTKDGTLWAALAHGLQERPAKGQAKTYTPGNNGLEAADFAQIFALPSGDIIAASKNGTLVRKNKNSSRFETISTSFAEKKRSLEIGDSCKGKLANNILILPFKGALAFFDYSTNRSVITLTQIKSSSLEEHSVKRVAVKEDTIWIDLSKFVWKRHMNWNELHSDNFLADPNSWEEVKDKKIPFAEEPKQIDTAIVNFPMRWVKTISVMPGQYAIAWDYYSFIKMQNANWGWAENESGYGDDQKTYYTKSLALLPNGYFAAGMWGPGLLTFDNILASNNRMPMNRYYHSTNSENKCPTAFSNSAIDGYTLVQGLVAAPDFSGYIFSYVSQTNYGLGFASYDGKNAATCAEAQNASSSVAFTITAKENKGVWEIYAAWRSSLESSSGGVDFYEVSNPKNFQPVLKKKWALPFGSPIDFAFDSKGTLWAVSQAEIFYLDKEDKEEGEYGKWKKPGSIRGFNGGIISALETDAQNGLWLSTIGDGAYFFSQTNDSPDSLRAKQFKVKNGLLSEIVYDIAIDTIKGRVYFANDFGLSIYNTALVRNAQGYMQSGAPKTIAYPNPFRPSQHNTVTIDNVTEKSSVYILDSFGKRVKFFGKGELKGGAAIWDGKNENGRTVAPGVYHYIAADGKKIAKGKIIIER
jgi:predicted dehydrogenase